MSRFRDWLCHCPYCPIVNHIANCLFIHTYIRIILQPINRLTGFMPAKEYRKIRELSCLLTSGRGLHPEWQGFATPTCQFSQNSPLTLHRNLKKQVL
jgi:hypothetical protein